MSNHQIAMKTLHIIAICLSVFFISDSFGKMYKWVDENGQAHFSDKPHEGPKAETLIEGEVRNNSLVANSRGKIIISPLISIPASAEVYKCIDADGRVTFTTKPGPGCTLLPGSVEKKPPPLKPPAPTPSGSVTKPMDKTIKYQSPRCTTKDGYFACLRENWLDHMTKFIIAKDYESINAYISSKKCVSIKGGLPVTVIDSPGMFDGKTSFIYKGIKYWTYREAINYR